MVVVGNGFGGHLRWADRQCDDSRIGCVIQKTVYSMIFNQKLEAVSELSE